MKSCPSCNTVNAQGDAFCRQCGKALANGGPPPSGTSTPQGADVTLRAAPVQIPRSGPRPSVEVAALFETRASVVIGRAPDCDVCLPHPTVSRRHAKLERLPDGRLRLTDLGSVNGVLVGGRRLSEPVVLHDRERVGIGPFLFTLSGGVIYSLDNSRSLRLEARSLEKVIPAGNGQVRKLLDNINLAVEPGEFVGLLGPSGSGKSTLMNCLNGRRRPSAGRVLANGEDFYRHFDSFRQSLGYVPQRDIVHTQLTVYRALLYTARLRLPIDTSHRELEDRIEAVLERMELGPHWHTRISQLSGGQMKRVSLGAELLAQPCLLYVDEATSGLDAGTEGRMMHLFREMADEGRSIVCITHNVENVDRCHLILVLAGGKLIFFGPPQEALSYFQIGRLSEVYDRLPPQNEAAGIEEWQRRFQDSSLYREFVDRRLSEPTEARAGRPAASAGFAAYGADLLREAVGWVRSGVRRPLERATPERVSAEIEGRGSRVEGRKVGDSRPSIPRPHHPPAWHQFTVLTARYAELLWADRRTLRLLLLQAPIVAVFLLLGFVNKPYQDKIPAPRPLQESERAVLSMLNDLSRRVDPEQVLTPRQREGLEKIRLPAGPGGRQISGEQVVKVLQNLQKSGLLRHVLDYPGSIVPDREIVNPHFTYMLLFVLAIAVLWFGCNNAAKEIVKEEAIYGRERAVNLGILPYLGSKFVVLALVSGVQTLLLMAVVYGVLQLLHETVGWQVPYPGHYLALLPQYGVLVLLALTGVALGLLLSAYVSNPDRATTLLPYVLIPQIILGGGMLSVTHEPLRSLAWVLSPVYWAYRAIHLDAQALPRDWPTYVNYPDGVLLPCGALAVQTAVLLLAAAWCLRRKDVTG